MCFAPPATAWNSSAAPKLCRASLGEALVNVIIHKPHSYGFYSFYKRKKAESKTFHQSSVDKSSVWINLREKCQQLVVRGQPKSHNMQINTSLFSFWVKKEGKKQLPLIDMGRDEASFSKAPCPFNDPSNALPSPGSAPWACH